MNLQYQCKHVSIGLCPHCFEDWQEERIKFLPDTIKKAVELADDDLQGFVPVEYLRATVSLLRQAEIIAW